MMYKDFKNFHEKSLTKNFAQAYPQVRQMNIPVLK